MSDPEIAFNKLLDTLPSIVREHIADLAGQLHDRAAELETMTQSRQLAVDACLSLRNRVELLETRERNGMRQVAELEEQLAAVQQDAARYLGDRDIAVGRRVEAERERDAAIKRWQVDLGHEIAKGDALRAKLDRLRAIAIDWRHHEDCSGYADEDGEEDAEPGECDCGTGDVLRETMPDGIKVYVDRTNEKYGMSRIVEPQQSAAEESA